MMDLVIPGPDSYREVHDESRQGEALVLPSPLSMRKGKNNGRKLYIESYGCAMNFSDSEIVASILSAEGFETTADFNNADVIFINTCSIRENAETRVRNRLKEFKVAKNKNAGVIVGVLGCMAERLKARFLEEEKLVDVVVGPDAYRDLPNLLEQVDGGQKAVNVLLSREETYADISPVRLNSNGINAFVSIMRGCDNMCSFCVVPFTRGRERSREPQSIINECRELFEQGYREVTLLGQNVDSYKWVSSPHPALSKGEGSAQELKKENQKVLSFGDDLGGAEESPHPALSKGEGSAQELKKENQKVLSFGDDLGGAEESPHPALSKGEGSAQELKKENQKVLSFGDDLGGAEESPHPALSKGEGSAQELKKENQKVLSFGDDLGGAEESPHPALSKGEGSAQELKKENQKVLSFGDDLGEAEESPHPALSTGEGSAQELKKENQKVLSFGEDLGEATTTNFANLLELVAQINPDLRVRFSTSHPKDITDEVLHTIARYDNICNYIHLPVQSGNSRILDLMNRTYDREWYINRVDAIRRIIPGCAISTDIITGFCTETEAEHQETVSIMDYVQYDYAYMFMYSERPGTLAAKRYADDVPEAVKLARLQEIVAKQRQHSFVRLQEQTGKVQRVLIEGFSKKSANDYCGRNDQNAMVVFPVDERYKPGDYAYVLAESSTTATLIGKIVPPNLRLQAEE